MKANLTHFLNVDGTRLEQDYFLSQCIFYQVNNVAALSELHFPCVLLLNFIINFTIEAVVAAFGNQLKHDQYLNTFRTSDFIYLNWGQYILMNTYINMSDSRHRLISIYCP